jgi:hypothetical protein
MDDVNQQIANVKANSRPYKTANIREVQGGFVVAGQTQYVDNTTKGVMFSENSEGVAADANSAAQMTLNYLRSGTFDNAAPVEQPAPVVADMFGTAQSAPASI